MDKTEYRYREEPSRGKKGLDTASLNGSKTSGEKAQELVAEVSKALPAIKKFSRENWRTIAMVSAGISVIAAGAYFYFNHQKSETTTRAHH